MRGYEHMVSGAQLLLVLGAGMQIAWKSIAIRHVEMQPSSCDNGFPTYVRGARRQMPPISWRRMGNDSPDLGICQATTIRLYLEPLVFYHHDTVQCCWTSFDLAKKNNKNGQCSAQICCEQLGLWWRFFVGCRLESFCWPLFQPTITWVDGSVGYWGQFDLTARAMCSSYVSIDVSRLFLCYAFIAASPKAGQSFMKGEILIVIIRWLYLFFKGLEFLRLMTASRE